MSKRELVRLMFPDRDHEYAEIGAIPVPGDGTLVWYGKKTWTVTQVVHDWDSNAETRITIYLKPATASDDASHETVVTSRVLLRKELKTLAGKFFADAVVMGDPHGAGLADAADHLSMEIDRLLSGGGVE